MTDDAAAGGAARLFTRQEVAAHNRLGDAYIIIDNIVYDVSEFLTEEHPGGPEVLLANAGRDASKCFRDVGHSEEARSWRRQFAVGEVTAEERWPEVAHAPPAIADAEPPSLAALLSAAAPPLFLAILAWWLHSYIF